MSGRGRIALLLAALWLPASVEAETHLRLVPQLRTGGGWASDSFLGADLGPSLEGQLAPSLRLDASLSPALKLWTEYDFTLGVYEATESNALGHRFELGGRARLGGGWSMELSLDGDAQELPVSQSLHDLVGLEASSTRGLGAAPALRLVAADLTFEALYRFEARRIDLPSGTIDDLAHLASLTLAFAAGPTRATISLRGLIEDATIPDFSYSGGSLHLGWALPLFGASSLRLAASIHHVEFDTGRSDSLLRASVTPSFALTDFLFLEPSYGWAGNTSDNKEREADRHFLFLGLRAVGEVWRR